MVTNTITVRDSFVVNALRNCGYNNYAAIADILDNSIEPDVNASKVYITLATKGHGTPIDTIQIADNGNGMDYETMQEALCLGSITGKTGTDNLGMYGTGLKSAALSIGKTFYVASLTEGSESGTLASFDISDACNNAGPVKITIDTIPAEQVKAMLKDNATHGTVVTITNLDRLSNMDRKGFGGTLRNNLGEIFNKYISSNICKFFVDNKVVEPVDLMANDTGNKEFLGNGKFDVDGKNFSFAVYYLPVESTTDKHNEGATRNSRNQGIYIYRQNRLIGRGLSLGLWERHPNYNGLRIELFTDGTTDNLLGTSFTKMVSEKSKETMSQSFKDTLARNLGPYIQEVNRRQNERYSRTNKGDDPETKKMYNNVVDEQNKNLLLCVNRKGENKPRTDKPSEHITRGPQKNPNPFRERKNKWLEDIREESLGRNEEMYTFQISNGKRIVLINTDHPFYTELYQILPIELKYKMAQVITCYEIAKQNVNYYGSDDIRTLVDTYNLTVSSEVGKSLSK